MELLRNPAVPPINCLAAAPGLFLAPCLQAADAAQEHATSCLPHVTCWSCARRTRQQHSNTLASIPQRARSANGDSRTAWWQRRLPVSGTPPWPARCCTRLPLPQIRQRLCSSWKQRFFFRNAVYNAYTCICGASRAVWNARRLLDIHTCPAVVAFHWVSIACCMGVHHHLLPTRSWAYSQQAGRPVL